MNEKTYNPPLHGRKSIIILCLDDVCKKKKKREGLCTVRDGRRANQRSLKSSEQKVMLLHWMDAFAIH
jgi:hypothetical protein